ncbi:MAG: outer membrane protein transport protein [Myxococcota bacterium]|nr:outer membrane protein transport protein [Myxococcota bacterium]
MWHENSVYRSVFLKLSGLLLTVTFATPSIAGGYYVGDVGTRGMARGGAFVAAPNSLLSIHYNPSGLALLDGGFHLSGDLNLVNYQAAFARKCPCVNGELADADLLDQELTESFIGRTAEETRGLQEIPYIGLAYGFDWNHLTVGLAVYGPQGPRRFSYNVPGAKPSEQPQRYSSLSVEVAEAYYSLVVAASPIKGLRLGFGAQLYQFSTRQELTLWANSGLITTPEDSDWDIPTVVEFASSIRPNWTFGASYDIVPGLTVGASVIGQRSIRADGTSEIQLPPSAASIATIEGSEIQLEINLPPIWRLGVQYQEPKWFAAEIAVVYEAWHVYDYARIRSKDVNIILNDEAVKLATIDLPYDFEDTWSLRIGGQFDHFAPYVTVYGGYFYEPSAVPQANKDLSSPDLNKHGFSGGIATQWFGTTLTLGAQYITLESTSITNSERKLVGPLPPPSGSEELLTTIANGDYSGNYFIMSASLSAAFDEILGEIK